ncbi:hypothetical protein V2J09_023944 [Rumex salicifolius]
MATHCKYPLFLFFLLNSIFILTFSISEPDILLTFKASLQDTNHSLSSWSKSSSSSSHYCNWAGITCNKTSIAVTSIDLQSLNISGELSSSICQLKSLTQLNLADNLFNQPIPLHFSECTSLKTLNLSSNLIWGTIPEQISQFGSLQVLDLSRNHIEGRIPEGIGLLVNLQVLNLASNLLSGNAPLVFGNFTKLVTLDLSENPFLVSELPSGIGGLDKLEQLFLQSCGFSGKIPESFVGLKGLRVLDLSQNNLTGEIPSTLLGLSLLSLVSVDVSANKLSGSFPNGVCDGKRPLASLSLHTNLFSGSISSDAISKCLTLERFQVQDNGFSGHFPDGLWSLPKIKLIRAENNRFSGQISDLISMAAQLEQVQIDNNSFSGGIPQGLGRLKNLYRFSASSNGLHGQLPPNFCDSPVMSIINLSHNKLSGKIPQVKNCNKLVSLSLADNNFTGGIPPSLGELSVLTYLDLSDNMLTGPIPQDLQNLKLALFNVSFNMLSGRVPSSLISGLPASYLQGNPGLCGLSLPKSCPDDTPNHPIHGLRRTEYALIAIALAGAIMITAFVAFVLHQRFKQREKPGAWFSVFFYPLRISEQDLVRAMSQKTVVRSVGCFGRVNIISLPNGELVAVKRLLNSGSQSTKTLKAEIKTMAKIRHKNIAKILGFCCTEDSIFLIYEYLPKGSLGDLIGKPGLQLQWDIRLRIAIGVAQGLAYLHKDYTPHILHRNIKSKNVLLDANFEPKLTDIALDRILGDAAFQSTLAFESPPSCYVAPEHAHSKRATEEMDTYSFGVVLLELITGRLGEHVVDTEDESLDIVKWVRRKVNIADGSLQILDPRISNSAMEEMLGALDVAMRCISVTPERRPAMADVVRALQSAGSSSKTCLPNQLQHPCSDDVYTSPV